MEAERFGTYMINYSLDQNFIKQFDDDIWEANNKEYIENYGKKGFNTRNFDKVFVNGFSREELERIYYPKLYEIFS